MPRPPTGGPPDQTPPTIDTALPEAGAVNVAADEIRLTFSEYVDQASFARAFSLTPSPEGRLDFNWRRRTVRVRLPEPLRPNTTYIVTLDTNLRDANNVAITQPITLAFSTGPRINQGRLTGQVLDAVTGTGRTGFDVYAYAAPDSTAPSPLPDVPDYRTQTNEEGTFTFEYLREQPYFVLAVHDQNRNRRPDATEAFAVPPDPALLADSTLTEPAPRWFATTRDTIPPEVQRVRARSSRRLELRFSEAVYLTTLATDPWMVEDSLANQPVAVQAVYTLPDDPRIVYLRTDSMAATPHRVHVAPVVADSSGNDARTDILGFTPPAEPDTLRPRFLGFVPPANTTDPVVLAPAEQPGLHFNQPIDSTRLHTAVAVQDTTGQTLAFSTGTVNGTTYRLYPDPPLQPGQALELQVDGRVLSGRDTVYTGSFRRISDRALGILSGMVVAPGTDSPIIVELYRSETSMPYATVQVDTAGTFIFSALPEGTYRFRAFVDRDDDGQWDGGSILPYRPAEPLTWSDAPAWRARWETSLSDTLRIR